MGPQPSKLQPKDISLIESLGIVLSQYLFVYNYFWDPPSDIIVFPVQP